MQLVDNSLMMVLERVLLREYFVRGVAVFSALSPSGTRSTLEISSDFSSPHNRLKSLELSLKNSHDLLRGVVLSKTAAGDLLTTVAVALAPLLLVP